jgi:hypothetical protein
VVPATLGLGTIDHVDPFHDSTRVCWVGACLFNLPKYPTAMHADGPVHETWDRALFFQWAAFGLGTMVHAEPFQDSTSVRVTEERVDRWPTAMHSEDPLHDTPLSMLPESPDACDAWVTPKVVVALVAAAVEAMMPDGATTPTHDTTNRLTRLRMRTLVPPSVATAIVAQDRQCDNWKLSEDPVPQVHP